MELEATKSSGSPEPHQNKAKRAKPVSVVWQTHLIPYTVNHSDIIFQSNPFLPAVSDQMLQL